MLSMHAATELSPPPVLKTFERKEEKVGTESWESSSQEAVGVKETFYVCAQNTTFGELCHYKKTGFKLTQSSFIKLIMSEKGKFFLLQSKKIHSGVDGSQHQESTVNKLDSLLLYLRRKWTYLGFASHSTSCIKLCLQINTDWRLDKTEAELPYITSAGWRQS